MVFLSVPALGHFTMRSSSTGSAEAFLTTTPYCIMPVTKINGVAIGDGCPGAIFHKLLAAWSKEVDIDILGQFNQK